MYGKAGRTSPNCWMSKTLLEAAVLEDRVIRTRTFWAKYQQSIPVGALWFGFFLGKHLKRLVLCLTSYVLVLYRFQIHQLSAFVDEGCQERKRWSMFFILSNIRDFVVVPGIRCCRGDQSPYSEPTSNDRGSHLIPKREEEVGWGGSVRTNDFFALTARNQCSLITLLILLLDGIPLYKGLHWSPAVLIRIEFKFKMAKAVMHSLLVNLES